MKTIFLTSSPFGPLDNSRKVEGFDPMNRLPENLSRFWKMNARCLVISAFPSDIPACIEMRESMERSIRVNFPDIACLDIWDDRTVDFSGNILDAYDVVFLGGGHVVYSARLDQLSRPIRSPETLKLISCHGVLINCIRRP